MNLSQLSGGVYHRLGVPSSDAAYPADMVTGFINDALRQNATEHDWPWLQGKETILTVVGTESVTPAADWTGTTALLITHPGTTSIDPLTEYTRDALDDITSTTTPGPPQAFAIYGDVLVLRPIPDAIYTLTHRYQRAEKVLVTGASPYLPDPYCPAICDLATVLCLGSNSEDSRATNAQRRYDAWLGKLADNKRRDRRPARLRIRRGAWL